MEVDSLLKFYFRLGLRHAEILSFLVLRHGVFISESTLKRALRRLQLFRRKRYSRLQNVMVFLQEEIQKSGQLHGYRWMHLRCLQKGFIVRQETVRFILQIIDPVGVEYRRRKRLRRRQYFNKGPNFLWHVDSYDKLKPYGIAINGCIDGFSRSIMWLEAGSTSNDPRVIAGYFLKTVYRCGGCPRTVRTDMGTENYYLEQIQLFFKRLEDDEHAPPAFIYGASTANQKIECWWSILRRHNAQFWMNLFSKLKEDGYFAGTFLDKSLIQFCFMDIIRDELDEICLEWNSHSISSSRNSINPTGRPFVMYNMPELYESSDYLLQVPDDEIEVVKNECTFLDKRMPCDKDIFELCNVLIEEGHLEKPSDPYNAVNLYVYLRTQILNLL